MKRAAILLLTMMTVACQKHEPPARAAAAAKKATKTATTATTSTAPRTEVGDTMPDYSAQDLDGKPFALASEKGKVVFVNVWATWCGPCRMEIPELQKLHDKYNSRGFNVVGVSIDDTGVQDVKKFVDQQKVGYPIVIDAEGKLANILQTTVLPTSVILDRHGKIIWRQVGALMPNDVAGVETTIEKAIASPSS